jgi:hypothetical protein
MVNASRNPTFIELDWSKLLGFDQFARPAVAASPHELSCAKVGVKPRSQVPHCTMAGLKAQHPLHTTHWAKVGVKL